AKSHADIGALFARVDDEVAGIGSAQHRAGKTLDDVVPRSAVQAVLVLDQVDDQSTAAAGQQPILVVRHRRAFPVPQLIDEAIERRSGAMRVVQDRSVAHGFRWFSSASIVFGQSSLSSRESERAARSFPPGWE